jgi:hypothetical protein
MERKGTNITPVFRRHVIRLKTELVYRSFYTKRFSSQTPFGFEK